MSARRRLTGRVKVAFEAIERIAAEEIAGMALAAAVAADWTLTKHSALYRRKDGSYTLCLVWHAQDGKTLTSTTRNIRLDQL